MDNPIKKIMQTEYKYIFVGIVVMILVFIIGGILIQGMNNVMLDQGISSTDTIVSSKYLDKNNDNFYIIVGQNNETFDIENDKQGTKMYNDIVLGKHYRFTVQNDTKSPAMHIIQVYNDTN